MFLVDRTNGWYSLASVVCRRRRLYGMYFVAKRCVLEQKLPSIDSLYRKS